MPNTIRLYTFSVTCPLPASKNGEPKSITTFVYDAKNPEHAKRIWFSCFLATARKNGLRGPTEKLRKTLKLIVERENKRELMKR